MTDTSQPQPQPDIPDDVPTPADAPTFLEARYFTASSGGAPTDAQREAVAKIREAIVQVASHIYAFVPEGRNRSLALTALEDVQMRAGRGIHADPANR